MSSHLTCMAGGKQSGGGGGKSSLGCIAQKWDIFTLHVPCGWALRREAHGARRRPTGEPGVGTDTGRRLRIRLPCQQRFAGFLDAPGDHPKEPAVRHQVPTEPGGSTTGCHAQEHIVTVMKPTAFNKMRQNTLLWCIRNICRRLPHVV